MATWTKPVDNRNQQDLAYDTDRAYTNFSDLNRIEENIQYMADVFNISITMKYNWQEGDFPRVSDRTRILNGVEAIRAYAMEHYPTHNANWYYDTPIGPLNTWQHWNEIENMTLRCYRAWQQRDIPEDEIWMPELIIDEEIGVI